MTKQEKLEKFEVWLMGLEVQTLTEELKEEILDEVAAFFVEAK